MTRPPVGKWFLVFEQAGEFGSGGTGTRIIDEHPFIWKSRRSRESQGHVEISLLSWQKLTADDLQALQYLEDYIE